MFNSGMDALRSRGSPCRDLSIPTQYANHPLVKDRLFFTLPPILLSEVIKEVGEERFDRGSLEMEKALAQLCGTHTHSVGFWGSRAIYYHLLHREPVTLTNAEAARQGRPDPAHVKLYLQEVNARTDLLIQPTRGYCGWLLTNRQFRDEHHGLFQRWAAQVTAHGIPRGEAVVMSLPPEFRQENDATEHAHAFHEFYTRWRLSHLETLFLPVPLQPQLPVAHLPAVLGHMRDGGTTFFLPDTCPIPSRDELRQILEDCAARGSAPEHLQEWQEIVRADNTGKSTIGRYGRLYELHHFWRALQQRHAAALKRQTERLERAFAAFFHTGPDTIHKDLGFIACNLGADWENLP